MIQIISKRRRIETISYSRIFDWAFRPGSGFGFPSDKDGLVHVEELANPAKINFEQCLTGTVDGEKVIDKGVREYRHTYTEPAIGKCKCGREVVLDGDYRGEGIDCDCGRIYNGLGQELAPRSQWVDDLNGEDY